METSVAHLSIYLWALWQHEVLLMSGVVSFLVAVWQYATGHNIRARVFWVIAATGLLSATFFAWNDEFKQVIGDRPRLEGSFLRIQFPHITSPRYAARELQRRGLWVMVGFEVRNIGAPSFASGFCLTVKSDTIDLPAHSPDPIMVARSRNSPLTMMMPFLEEQIANKAIPHNERAQGYIPYVLPNVTMEQITKPGTTWMITFEDADHQPYASILTMPSNPDMRDRYIGGLGMVPNKVIPP